MAKYISSAMTLIAVAVACLSLSLDEAAAELIIMVDDVTISSLTNQTVDGFIDIYFEASGDSVAPLAGYDIAIDLTPSDARVALIGVVNPSGARNPVFPQTPPFDAGSSTDRILATAFVNPGLEEMIDDGEGLVRVVFRVGVGVTGSFDLRIDSSNTNLSDAGGSVIAFTSSGGTITVVPEPATAFLVLGPISFAILRRTNQFIF